MELNSIPMRTSSREDVRNGELAQYARVVDWDDENDPMHPFNWPKRKKWTITLAAMYVCFIVGINSTAIASASTTIQEGNEYWPVAAWNAGAAVAPLAGLPLMEHFGVRSSFLVSSTSEIIQRAFCLPRSVPLARYTTSCSQSSSYHRHSRTTSQHCS